MFSSDKFCLQFFGNVSLMLRQVDTLYRGFSLTRLRRLWKRAWPAEKKQIIQPIKPETVSSHRFTTCRLFIIFFFVFVVNVHVSFTKLQIILALLAHTVWVGASGVPLNSNPTVFSKLSNHGAGAGKWAVLHHTATNQYLSLYSQKDQSSYQCLEMGRPTSHHNQSTSITIRNGPS